MYLACGNVRADTGEELPTFLRLRAAIEKAGFELLPYSHAQLDVFLQGIEGAAVVVVDLDGGHYGDTIWHTAAMAVGLAIGYGKPIIGYRSRVVNPVPGRLPRLIADACTVAIDELELTELLRAARAKS